jgi:hypothetical protein
MNLFNKKDVQGFVFLQTMNIKRIAAVLCSTCIIISGIACKQKDKKGAAANGASNTFFYDYKVVAEEGNDNLLVMAQIKKGGEEADGEILPQGASLQIDGQPMEIDSAKIGGIYYEKYMNIDSFAGSHQLVLQQADGKSNEAVFNFLPFALLTNLDKTISRKAFRLQFAGLDALSDLRIVLTDTSFESEGVNELWQAKDSILTIGPAMLANLKNGPVQLTLTREQEQPLKGGGRLLMLYTIRKEFVLAD